MIVEALRNPACRAVVTARRLLRYTNSAAGDAERPPHVRSASGVAVIGERLIVVQDDVNYLAEVDLAGSCISHVLPAGRGGLRTFSKAAGTKPYKWDLESAYYDPARDLMLAFGSGSAAERDRVVMARGWRDGAPDIRVIEAGGWYDALRAHTEFSGSELNLEGVAPAGDSLTLFQRGNGASIGALEPVNAIGRVSYSSLLAYLEAGAAGDPPALTHVRRYDLGKLGGVRLTFTDAAVDLAGRVCFLAVSEDSPNVYDDGPAVGAAFGRLHEDGSATWCPIETADGEPFLEKAEGLAFTPQGAFIALDTDDPERPAELCALRLEGW